MNKNYKYIKLDLRSLVNNTFDLLFESSEEHLRLLEINHLDLMLISKLSLNDISENNKIKIIKAKFDYQKNLSSLKSIIECFNETKIDYRILKGALIADSYPFTYSRLFGDHDLLIKKEDLEKSIKILHKNGYFEQNNIKTVKDISFFRNNFKKVELHFDIADEKKDAMTTEILELIWRENHEYYVNSQTLNGPKPQSHLIYMVYHIQKHFAYSGCGLRHLVDLKYFTEKHCIDLNEVDVFFKKFGNEKFYRSLIMLCVDELDLNFDYQSLGWIRDDLLQEKLFEYASIVGTFGNGSTESSMTNLYDVNSHGDAFSNRMSVFFNFLFPSKNDLVFQYPFVQKYNIFVPIAWILRWWKQIFNKKYSFKEKMFVFTLDKRLLNHKFYLLKEFGLRQSEAQEEIW